MVIKGMDDFSLPKFFTDLPLTNINNRQIVDSNERPLNQCLYIFGRT